MPSHHFLIIHGTGGTPSGNWFPWLKGELESRGHAVHLPAFPTPQNQSFDSWLLVVEKQIGSIDPSRIVLVGHSIGCAFSFRLAERTKNPYRFIIGVCPFVDLIGQPDYDKLNSSFVQHVFDWQKIKKNVGGFHFLAGDNDPYVPTALSQKIADGLGQELHLVKNGGHLNAEFGYARLDPVLSCIDSLFG